MKTLLLAFAFSTLILRADAADPRRFDIADGSSVKGEFIDTDPKTGERLYLRYPLYCDGGAELEMTVGDSLIWREYVVHLGVTHSTYRQVASMTINEGKIFVTITSIKIIKEVRELKTGKLISRAIEDRPAE